MNWQRLLVLFLMLITSYITVDILGGDVVSDQRHWLPGQWPYLISKIAALLVVVIVFLQLLVIPLNKFEIIRVARSQHKILGLTCLLMVGIHVVGFFVAVWLRTGSPPYGLLVPNFDHGYYKTGLSLGLMALVVFLVGVLGGVVKFRLKGWSYHRLIFVAFAFAVFHGLMIGSESQSFISLLVILTAIFVSLIKMYFLFKKHFGGEAKA